jgi:DNA primase
LVFDSDAAGKKAAERGLDLLLGEDMDLFVAELPPEQDADDVIQKSGPDALRAILCRPKEMFAFLVESLSARIDTTTPSGKTRIVGELLDRIATAPNPVKQAFLVKEVAAKFGIAEGLLMSRLRREEPVAAAAPKARTVEGGAKIGRELLALLVGAPEIAAKLRQNLPPEKWPDAASAAVARKAFELIDRTGAASASDLLALVQEKEPAEALAAALERPVDPARAGKILVECLANVGNQEFKTEKAGVLHGHELMAAKLGAPRDVRLLPRQRTKQA